MLDKRFYETASRLKQKEHYSVFIVCHLEQALNFNTYK